MSQEGAPQKEYLETGLERIPTTEEVRTVFEQLLEGKEFEEARKHEDEKGLWLWEIIVKGQDGSYSEYAYVRKGRYAPLPGKSRGIEARDTAVCVAFYDADGMPGGGETVARLEEGAWKILL
ncbi:MAG: hypothetical protein A3D67_03495 [Candidatus Lloydbacteria bacterium RIFCSPHIGHO2_02_FULL_51_22]|uniref:Uncharacterized protein n=2 Tax=Candidatus Lloydiibacteriota TaxID=1817910 RepID=A0A1G2DBH3_9BACT|nr:MAG: hypothetical protein A3D67_03495 [Candidatus Lloydbacteria bacterium RIFCSPHIGHO2_02_FULL_51_22]OGZ15829.1 MAG: hypothetical protein A3G11_02600 [Candidatus Lloydbacteria bacterium RIFCSPLOWO2_12_FULL_51_9]